jgi:hypothetical protein
VQLNSNKFENKAGMNHFPGKYRLSKLIQEDKEKLSRPTFIEGIEN